MLFLIYSYSVQLPLQNPSVENLNLGNEFPYQLISLIANSFHDSKSSDHVCIKRMFHFLVKIKCP